jgi:hypothetical protein
MLASTRHGNEASAMLAEIYNWFTEGFDTVDLREASAPEFAFTSRRGICCKIVAT